MDASCSSFSLSLFPSLFSTRTENHRTKQGDVKEAKDKTKPTQRRNEESEQAKKVLRTVIINLADGNRKEQSRARLCWHPRSSHRTLLPPSKAHSNPPLLVQRRPSATELAAARPLLLASPTLESRVLFLPRPIQNGTSILIRESSVGRGEVRWTVEGSRPRWRGSKEVRRWGRAWDWLRG